MDRVLRQAQAALDAQDGVLSEEQKQSLYRDMQAAMETPAPGRSPTPGDLSMTGPGVADAVVESWPSDVIADEQLAGHQPTILLSGLYPPGTD